MIEIISYIKANDQFISIENFNGPLKSEFFIDGAILLTVDEKPILTFESWDLVDQLWIYLVGLMNKVSKERIAKTNFPDQSLEIGVESIFAGQKIKLWVGTGQDSRQAIMDKDDFFAAFCEAGTIFFTKMAKLVPAQAREYETFASSLKALAIRNSQPHS